MKENSKKIWMAYTAYQTVHGKPVLPRHVAFITGIPNSQLAQYRRELEESGLIKVTFVHNPNGGNKMASVKVLKHCHVSDVYLKRARACPDISQAEINLSKTKNASCPRKNKLDLNASIERVVRKALGGIGTMGGYDAVLDYRKSFSLRTRIHATRIG